MNVGVPATDTGRIEVLAQDLPCFAGAQLAVNITLRSALTRNGEEQAQAENIVQSCLKPDTTRNGATLSWQDPGAADSWWWASKQACVGATKQQNL